MGFAEAISPTSALKAMTLDAAWQSFLEDSRGSIESGKLADFIVVDGDPLDPRVMENRGWRVAATYIGGELQFESEA